MLPQSGTARLERLRLPGVRFAAVTAACRRLPKTPLGDLVAIASLEEGGDRTVPAADMARLLTCVRNDARDVTEQIAVVWKNGAERHLGGRRRRHRSRPAARPKRPSAALA
ncbi:MAG: hypothetical protein HC900_02370, partial [Methylacidiphilales bacterium]|nr:hypothetical protein [Candidatus Methylacidiphilales bacterium]